MDMEITFKARNTNVAERFRRHVAAKLARLEKLDQRVVRVDVEVSEERNPRQADRRERVELTIRSRGPAIRAEAAADDRYAALDLALAKLESRLRRACDRRKPKRADLSVRSPEVVAAVAPATAPAMSAAVPAIAEPAATAAVPDPDGMNGPEVPVAGAFVPIQMEGDGPVVVREKVHHANAMTIDEALMEMELVGHDFYLFHDSQCDRFSVVYRRRGYDYGVIRLIEK
jgi:ribosomal subunit interface protein